MLTAKVRLNTGLRIGKAVHMEVVIRDAPINFLLEAQKESRRQFRILTGIKLFSSNTLVALNTLRRAIVRVGDHPGPLTLDQLMKLSARDLELLMEKAGDLEAEKQRRTIWGT